MDGPRAPLEAEFPSIVSFLDAQLRPDEGWSITSEYPVAISPTNLSNIRIIKENDQVLSHAVMRPLIIKTPAGLFKVAGIGSVVTSTEHRNQGLSRQIIESCLASARDHGCDFAILWTNLYDFYRRLGFELAGSEVSVVLEKEMPIPDGGFRFMDTAKVSPEAIHRLYSEHTVTSLRNLDETRKYLQIPNSHVYTAWDSAGLLKAYAIEGKGADLQGYIHEWGGSVSALLPLFAYARQKHGKPLTVILPRHSTNLISKLRALSPVFNEGHLGMIKLLNTSNLFSKVKRYSRALGFDDFIIEKQVDAFYIGYGENVFKTDSEADVVRLMFGPQKASDLAEFDPKTREAFDKVFPLQMWIWGWDSI